MKNKKLLIAILCIFVFDLPGAANRIRQNFDFDWQFRLGENGDFREVQLPHDWSVELDFDEKAGGASGYLPGGIGWYRKSFMIPASYKNQKVSLVFDGIYHKATIFLNGKEIAYHRYGNHCKSGCNDGKAEDQPDRTGESGGSDTGKFIHPEK